MRVVTNVVLTVSDVDFFLSFLFLYELYIFGAEDTQWFIFMGLVMLGQVTYLLGICYFGPKQSKRVMGLVLALMENSPQIFESATWKYSGLTGTSVIHCTDPKWDDPDNQPVMVRRTSLLLSPDQQRAGNGHRQSARSGPETFADLQEDDDDHQELFKKAMQDWGVISVVITEKSKNSINSVGRVHGTPLIRTARFGFMAVPSPMDLAGLLNANALYSFATGILQLIFGTFLVLKKGASIQRVLPMSVAFVSLLLCLANVIFDFGAALCELEGEKQEASRILSKWESKQEEDKRKADRLNAEVLAQITTEYRGRTLSPTQMLEKQERLDGQTEKYAMEIADIDERVQNLVRLELTAFNKNLEEKKKLMSGKGTTMNLKPNTMANAATDAAMKRRSIFNNKEAEIQTKFDEEFAKIDIHNEADFAQTVERLRTSRDAQLEAIRRAKICEAGGTPGPQGNMGAPLMAG